MDYLYMIGQNRGKDDFKNIQNPMSLILKRNSSKPVNLILNKDMKANFFIGDKLRILCEFSVVEGGYYHISSQITIKNMSKNPVEIEYLQFGICKEDMSDYQDLLKSQIINSSCLSDYVISDSLCSIMKLEKDEKYNMWINLGCSISAFEYQSEFSNLRIYKL